MRHGQAEMMASCDSDRSLTFIGREQSKKMAGYLADTKVEFDAALVSPYLRAQQTFTVVSALFPKIKNQQTLKFLTPGGSATKTVAEVMTLQASGVESVLIVSHLPLVGYLVAELVPSAGGVSFATSAVAHIVLDDQGVATLNRLIDPEQIN